MKIEETCSCGASIEVEDKVPDLVRAAVTDWRKNHKHVIKTEPYVVPTIPTEPYRQPYKPYWYEPTITC